MKEPKTTRSAFIKVRFTEAEKKVVGVTATALGMTMSDFIRQRTLEYRVRQSPLEKERNILLARISSNMNQIARVANTYKAGMDALRIIAALADIRNALEADTPPAPCATGCANAEVRSC